MNRFDNNTHTYTMGAERVPSVTEVISPLIDYSMVPEDKLSFARDRGSAAHLACHLSDMGSLDEGSVDAEHVAPYLAAWRKFRADTGATVDFSEVPMFHEGLRFAGTPDRGMVVNGRRVLIDIKTTSALSPAVGVQLGGYALLAGQIGWVPHMRWAVRLRPDGSYSVSVYNDESPTFLSLLTVHNWRKRNAC